jgi:hypothetical protein
MYWALQTKKIDLVPDLDPLGGKKCGSSIESSLSRKSITYGLSQKRISEIADKYSLGAYPLRYWSWLPYKADDNGIPCEI